MRIIKFSIKANAYEDFVSQCKEADITIKKKINVLLSQDKCDVMDINEFFPENPDQNLRIITLKVNEELFKGVMKNSDKLDIKSKRYIPYLIYKDLSPKKY